jgi:uncharacterized protein involved in exopolysaccharide biosynthesis
MRSSFPLLIKGLPVILISTLLALFVAQKVMNYTPNTYRSIARIKLVDQQQGFRNKEYSQELETFRDENKIGSEAEVMKSPLIIGKTLDRMGSFVRIARIGQLRNTDLYEESPIVVTQLPGDRRNLDRIWRLDTTSPDEFLLGPMDGEKGDRVPGRFGVPVRIGQDVITISTHPKTVDRSPAEGSFAITIHSRDGLIADISERLDITAVDKEVAVLRVVFTDRHAKRAADLTNALCETYMEDYVAARSAAAQQTVHFIDEKLQKLGDDLKEAEAALETYKQDNGVVNTLQETETRLRQISNLELQRINLEMNEKAMAELEQQLTGGGQFEGTSVNVADPVFAEMTKRLKDLRDERRDLLQRYTATSGHVISHDEKIAEVVKYIRETMAGTQKEMLARRRELDEALLKASVQFTGLPKRERDLQVLEREFQLQKQVYEFLSQKRIEASIAASALVNFHRVLQPAVEAMEPTSPNRTLISFLAALLGLISGTGGLFLWKAYRGRVTEREEIERRSSIPIGGVVRKGAPANDMDTLVKSWLVKKDIGPGSVITISSAVKAEGRTTIAQGLAIALTRAGFPVTLIHQEIGTSPERVARRNGYLEVIRPVGVGNQEVEHIGSRRNTSGVIVIDTLPTASHIDGVQAMKAADLAVHVVRAGHTELSTLIQADMIKAEYGLGKVQIVLNDADPMMSYSGIFMGWRFQNGQGAGLQWSHLGRYFKPSAE